MKTTRTNGRLHFEDLDPMRFEDLALSMVYRLNRWEVIHHFGRSGNDDGIDIQAVEELENGSVGHGLSSARDIKISLIVELRLL